MVLPGVRGEQRLERLSHRFALIQVHAQVALRFRQSKQPRSNSHACSLLPV